LDYYLDEFTFRAHGTPIGTGPGRQSGMGAAGGIAGGFTRRESPAPPTKPVRPTRGRRLAAFGQAGGPDIRPGKQ
jgi:hypothetical protein